MVDLSVDVSPEGLPADLAPDALGELHFVFVRVMGGAGYHMHTFRFGGGFKQDDAPAAYSLTSMGPIPHCSRAVNPFRSTSRFPAPHRARTCINA